MSLQPPTAMTCDKAFSTIFAAQKLVQSCLFQHRLPKLESELESKGTTIWHDLSALIDRVGAFPDYIDDKTKNEVLEKCCSAEVFKTDSDRANKKEAGASDRNLASVINASMDQQVQLPHSSSSRKRSRSSSQEDHSTKRLRNGVEGETHEDMDLSTDNAD